MGCDIHPAIEYRKADGWHYHRPKADCPYYYDYTYDPVTRKPFFTLDEHGDKIRSKWDDCKYRLPEFFTDRNYAVFALLADVRNDGSIIPIQRDRGLPGNVTNLSKAQLSNEHSAGFVTLDELKSYDFKREVEIEGFLSEEQFKELVQGVEPKEWQDYIWNAKDANIVGPAEYARLHESPIDLLPGGNKRFIDNKTYLIKTTWKASSIPYVSTIPTEWVPYLEKLVPKGGTDEDVRVIFDFDS